MILNCSGVKRFNFSERYATSFFSLSPNNIRSLDIDNFSQILFNVETVMPATPLSMSETFFVPSETSSPNSCCVNPARSLAVLFYFRFEY